MRQPGFHRIILVVCIILAGLAGCDRHKEEKIKIGVLAPLEILSGRSAVNAGHLALERVNSQGGIPLDTGRREVALVFEDSGDTPQHAVEAARRLLSQKEIVAIVGPNLSSKAIPVGKLCEDAGVPMISPLSTNLETTRDKEFVFRVAFVDPFQGRIMARFARQEFNAATAAVLYDATNVYCRGLASVFKDVFESLGGVVVNFESYTPDSPIRAPLLRIKEQSPDVLFLPNLTSQGLIEQGELARSLGLEMPLLGGDGWDPILLAQSRAFAGSFFCHHWSAETDDPVSKDFVAAYERFTGETPTPDAALVYDAFGLLFNAMLETGDADSDSIREGLYRMGPYFGVTGAIDYRDSGDPVKSAVIFQITREGTSVFKRVDPQVNVSQRP